METKVFSSDAELWCDFLQGSKPAFACLYETFAPILYNYGYKIAQDRALTEDCIQDVFLTLLERREHLSTTTSIKFYLFCALRREIVKRLKERQSHADWNEESDLNFSVRFSTQSSWLDERESQELSGRILRILNELPPRQKEALFLRFYDDLPYDQIARIMEIGQTSAYKVVYKALASLQKKLPDPALWLGLLLAWLLPDR